MSEGGEGGESLRWLLTYADMITLLMAFFIMMYTMSNVNVDKFAKAASGLRAEFGAPGTRTSLGGGSGLLPHLRSGGVIGDQAMIDESLQSVKDRLEEYIQDNEMQNLISATHEVRGLVITLASDNLLFPVSEADLRPPALAILAEIADLLQTIPNGIVIEGHTCGLPIKTPRYPSNWELSAARSCAVVRYLMDQWNIDPVRLGATGYADSRSVAPNDTEEQRFINRRVEIVILPTATPDTTEAGAAPLDAVSIADPEAPAPTDEAPP